MVQKNTFWRNFSPFVYKVSDTIKFKLYVNRFNIANSPYEKRTIVYERMGDGSNREAVDIRANETFIEAKASYTGDTKIILASLSSVIPLNQIGDFEAVELFDEDVRSINSYMFGWMGVVVSVLPTSI